MARKTFKIILSLAGGGFVFMSQTSANTAATNLSSWIEALGLSPPGWSLFPHIDTLVTVMALGVIIYALFFMPDAQRERRMRSLDKNAKKAFCQFMQIHNMKEFSVYFITGDSEAFQYACKIRTFLTAQGYVCRSMISDSGIVGGDGKVSFHPDAEEGRAHLMIGSNIVSGMPLQSTGGVMTSLPQ